LITSVPFGPLRSGATAETQRSDHFPLRDLPAAHYEEYTTLVIPPLGELREDPARAPGACAP
jgi:hypothetical protein